MGNRTIAPQTSLSTFASTLFRKSVRTDKTIPNNKQAFCFGRKLIYQPILLCNPWPRKDLSFRTLERTDAKLKGVKLVESR